MNVSPCEISPIQFVRVIGTFAVGPESAASSGTETQGGPPVGETHARR